MKHAAGQRGLTLIELMVALAIFAILGVLSYRALAEVATSNSRLEENFERWRTISRTLQRIDTDLIQVVAPAMSSTARSASRSGVPSRATAMPSSLPCARA